MRAASSGVVCWGPVHYIASVKNLRAGKCMLPLGNSFCSMLMIFVSGVFFEFRESQS